MRDFPNRIVAIGLAIALFALQPNPSSGQSVKNDQGHVDSVIAELRSQDKVAREAAQKRLDDLSKGEISVTEGIALLRAATGTFPPPKYDWQDMSESLVSAASKKPRAEYIPVILEEYAKYKPRGKAAALSLLARLPDREGTIAYMELLKTHARTKDIPSHNLSGFATNPRHADVLFPDLLQYADQEEFQWGLFTLCLTYCQQEKLSNEALRQIIQPAVSAYRPQSKALEAAQQAAGVAWMWTDKYATSREMGALLLDLFGYLPPDTTVESKLRSALDYHDPKLKLFAATSLLRLGKPVPPEKIAEIAASNEIRISLFSELKKLGQFRLFPAKFLNQAALAESDMVHWLTYPTELAQPPDEIELMKVVSGDTRTGDEIIDYYVFRFRTHEPHWAAKKGWLAGVSGPYFRKAEPTDAALGETFSRFEPWESKTAEEHVGATSTTLQKWREYRAKQVNK